MLCACVRAWCVRMDSIPLLRPSTLQGPRSFRL